MGYFVKYKELKTAENTIIKQINQWYNELEAIKMQIKVVASMQDIKGDTADSIKSYMNEVHLPIITMMQRILKEYQYNMLRYCSEHYQIDTSLNALILQDRLDNQITVINTRTGIFQEIESKVSQGIGMAAGLANVSMPSGERIIESYDTLRSDVAKLMNEVGECEYKHLRSDFQSIEGMLTNVLQLIHRQSQKENVKITAYQAQSLSTVPEYHKLGEASSSTNTKIEEIKKESIDYSELNAIYWNRTDDYFTENWTDNSEKFEEALEIIKLEAIQCGGLDLFGQVTQLGYAPDNHRLQALIKLSQINQASMSKDVVITEVEKEKDWKNQALGYLLDSGEQILLGNYTDEVTLLGTAGEVILGLIGFDLPMDIRDLLYDITHFELSWKWVGSLAIDIVSILPVIGLLKYSDEAATLAKRWTKNSDEKVEIAADTISALGKKFKKLIDSGAKKVSSAAKSVVKEFKDSKGIKKANEILEGLRKKVFKTEVNVSFADNIVDVLKKEGLTLEEFNKLRLKNVNELSSNEITKMKAIRDAVPKINSNTIIQKTISAEDIAKYLGDDGYSEIGGYIVKFDDVSHISGYENIVESLRLDYVKADGMRPYPDGGNVYGYIKFSTEDVGKIDIPYGQLFGGTNTDTLPCTLNGFTAARNGEIIPEWTVNGRLRPNVGAELHEVVNGKDTIIGIFDGNHFQ